MTEPVVVTPDRGRIPLDTPLLRADDLGAVRGDGIFETLHVRAGEAWLVDPHLDRMARSAARVELDLPDRATLTGMVATACQGWPPEVEGALRLVCTRGPENGGPVSVFATLRAVPPEVRELRRRGAALATATLGVTVAVRGEAPWLLGGVKAVSYAVNLASQRWAAGQGFDDVLWLSTDGYALEAPTSSLVWLAGDELSTVPADRTGILAGTTARWLLDQAPTQGWAAAERMVRPEELAGADGVWLASSIRGAVPVRELDRVPFRASPHTGAIQRLLGHPV